MTTTAPALSALAPTRTPLSAARLLGIGAAQPELTITATELGAPFGRTAEWIRARTGIHAVRRVAPMTEIAHLAAQAASTALERAGLEREAALAALRPLQHRTIDVAGSPPTGPIARGDATTVAAHLRAVGPELEPLYRALGRATLPIVPPASAAAVRELL